MPINGDPKHEQNVNDRLIKRTYSKENIIAKDEKLTEDGIQQEKRSTRINLICVYLGCLLVQSPFLALTNSVTSLLQDEGMGFTGLAVGGVAQPLACALMVTYTMKVWGIRKMVSFSMAFPFLFNISFFYPVSYIAIPAGAFVGLTNAMITSAAYVYVNTLGFWYAKLSNGNIDNVMAVTSGIINSSLGGGFLLGNIVLYAILGSTAKPLNGTNSSVEICGKNYCNEDISNLNTMQPPEPWRYYTLIGVFAAMTSAGIFISLFLRDFTTQLGHVRRKKSEFFLMLKEMWLLLKDPRGYLLIVIPTFVGIEEGFIMSDFTQGFISCVTGIPNVGLLMFGYGIAQIVFSYCQGILTRYIGRMLTVSFGTCLLMGCFVYLLLWNPNPDQIGLLAAVLVLWSAGDALVISTVFGMYTLLFEDNVEGSFAVGNFWFSMGCLLSFGWSQFLCIKTKLYIMLAIGGVGLVSYLRLEIMIKRKKEIKS